MRSHCPNIQNQEQPSEVDRGPEPSKSKRNRGSSRNQAAFHGG